MTLKSNRVSLQDELKSKFWQFRLSTLMAAVAVCALLLWWVTWPEHVAREFVESVSQRNFVKVEKLVAGDLDAMRYEINRLQMYRQQHKEWTIKWRIANLQSVGRSPMDLLAGQQEFLMNLGDGVTIEMTVRRGQIVNVWAWYPSINTILAPHEDWWNPDTPEQ